jgi:hypothetical protein
MLVAFVTVLCKAIQKKGDEERKAMDRHKDKVYVKTVPPNQTKTTIFSV